MLKNKKNLLIIVIAITLFGFWFFDLKNYLSLSYLKSQQDAFSAFYAENRFVTLLGYFILYVVMTAFSFPGAAILSLAGGLMFGLVMGTVIVSFASTIGATLAFLIARFILRDSVEKKYGSRLHKINQGIEKEGDFFLFALRLVPVVPFFLINLLMGLTKIKIWTFFWVSQIGMIPGTIAYIYAGTQLGEIESLKDILSPGLLFAFAFLGVLPLIMRHVLDYMRAQKVYKPWQNKKPDMFDYNMIVIGGGAAGLVTSYIAAALKAKVALVEKHKMGGDCLNTGCVPSKALIRSAKFAADVKAAEKFGFKPLQPDYEVKDIMGRVHGAIKDIEPHDSVERYTKLGVDCFEETAEIIDPWHVKIGGEEVSARNIVLATGAEPFVPPIPGLDTVEYWTSDTLWDLKKMPKHLVVLGGGPIGCEMAQSFARLGVKVTQVEMADRLMGREDQEVSEYVKKTLEKDGVSVLLSHKVVSVSSKNKTKKEKTITCMVDGGEDVELVCDGLLLALGRAARLDGFGLQKLDVELRENKTIAADPLLRTNYPNIYVCGDATGPYQFTHMAAHQAWYASVNALLSPFKSFQVDYSIVPWATFTDPEVARVGLNEQDAKASNIAYEVTTYGLDDLDRAITESAAEGFVKVLTPPGSDKILGVTIVGQHAGDLIAEFVLAMKHGLGLNKILGTIHIYPTWAESAKYAAGAWKRENKPEWALKLIERFHRWRRGEKTHES